ncbi:Por secretion system C-terminal sorting domain-containing protein [Mariniphaga anaerophila]|uniref:Por secretion system C-terminal sorting domain-containing protein n=1 Tax=Mariniphaga anaerophila TaxID=1484053 RepID=A0A1M5CY25_9BACT|nr:T9SS type A sorting domain-containing protein [Mariniphaga anaerophila]SHF59581.1 Por secretion system C-terminal sorting domain-containing protein [Mariniphaga anaerophila]
MQKGLVVFFMLAVAFSATGQKLWQKRGITPVPQVCYASDKVEKGFIPPPAEVMSALKSAEQKSDFIVTYNNFSPEAQQAFSYAISILEQLFESSVPVYVDANWSSLGKNVLGNCGPSDYKRNFEEAPQKNVYYPIALAEKISRKELTGSGRPDILANFNQDINWYFGTDGDTPALQYDLVSVVLHEMCHGLGFTGFFYVEGQVGGYGWSDGEITSFDRLVEKFDGTKLIDAAVFANPSVLLKNTLESGLLYANSPVAVEEGSTKLPRLYAPSSWDDGSSIYHLNEVSYPAGNINSLMTPALSRGEAIHNPGPLAMGIFGDLGWKTTLLEFTPIKDQEQVKPLDFNVEIVSDLPLDTAELFVVVSSDTFNVQVDSIPLTFNENGYFEAQWTPDAENPKVQYYLTAKDQKGRVFTNPFDAPEEFFEVNFGPDDILPEVEHDSIPYFFATGKSLEISVRADDNLGIDTVYVEYSINGQPQPPFGLSHGLGMHYSSVFPLVSDLLNEGDLIEYSVVAKDVSVSKNTTRLPSENSFSFRVEKMFEPVADYQNSFDNPTTDFILFDFDIYTEKGFESGALHSLHPYPSPGLDDAEFNFICNLKYPIVLSSEAQMSFDEIVLVEPGSDDTAYGDFEFWDYVIVEGSKDFGETWLPVTDGYDARESESWEVKYNDFVVDGNSLASGNPNLFVNKQINIFENGNFSPRDTVLFRFRLYSDPYAHGWGWAIDNLQIQSPLSALPTVLSPGDFTAYPNPFSGSFHLSVRIKKQVEKIQVELFNVYGQKIKEVNYKNVLGTISEEIEIDNGPGGLYLLVVKENGKQVFAKKLIRN